MPRIALVNDVAGVAKLQVRLLREAGYDADFIPLPITGAEWAWPAKALSIAVRLARYVPIAARLRRRSYDWIHVHYVPHGVIGIMSGLPFLLQAHGSDLHVNVNYPTMWRPSSFLMKRARGIAYVTPNLRRYLAEFEAKSFLLLNPIDERFFQNDSTPSEVRKVLIFARLDPVKGVAEIVEHAREIAGVAETSALDWGPLARQYKALFGAYLKFVPLVPHAQVPALLMKYDCVIGQMHQGILSLSELEALAGGRPVITRLDARLYADDPPPVIQVETGGDIVTALRRLRELDKAELKLLAVAGREWAERNHSVEAHTKRLVEIYGKVFGSIAIGARTGAPL